MMQLLRAGLITVGLLALGRLAGLLREVALAGAFGVSAEADVVVAVLSLPDWLAGVVAAGAVTYVLVPHWASRSQEYPDQLSNRFLWVLRGIAWALGASLMLVPHWWLQVLAAAASSSTSSSAFLAMQITGAAVVMSFEAVLPQARLLSGERWVALHVSNLLLSLCLLLALVAIWTGYVAPASVVFMAAVGVVAHVLRWAWLQWQTSQLAAGALIQKATAGPSLEASPGSRQPTSWLAASLAVGLPYALPFVARSAGAQSDAGDLASFSYAWKLVELPLTLVLQWLGLLALPALARAQAAGDMSLVRGLFSKVCALSFALACAFAVALVIGSQVWVQLLFGWGRLSADQLSHIATLAAWGGLSLPAQAFMSVGLTYAAVSQGLRQYAWSALLGSMVLIIGLLWYQPLSLERPTSTMLVLVAAYATVALALVVGLVRARQIAIPWRTFWGVSLASIALAVGGRIASPWLGSYLLAMVCMLAFVSLVAVAIRLEPGLKALLRR